ncbi:MAG TPA: HYR domain-containing protein, partial [Anaerolineales bacterium]|nr:HYR domain-containing protein [Anaerolineales bacterium]
GTFNNNQEYGVEIASPANTTLNIWTAPTCTGNDSNSPPTSNCYNVTTVVDLEPPVISFVSRIPAPNVNGWNSTNVTVAWSCTDALSGVVSSTVTQTLSIEGANQSVTGTCEDLSGNTASDTQTGISIDFTDPTLNLPGNLTAEATGPSGAAVIYSVSASDNLDNSPTVTCLPASGSTFAIGTTTVSCSATDDANNSSTESFTITVADTTAPTLTLPANITEQVTGPAGNVVTFSASASDLVDGARPITCVPPSGSTFLPGMTTVNCSAIDTRGNTATGAFTVTIQDTTAPSISAMADIFASTRNASKVVYFSSPTTYDVVDGPGVATCKPPSGSNFPVGDTIVTCTATDRQGNTASVTFMVTVIYTRVPTTTIFSSSSSGGGGIILVTGGELIDLDCTSSVNAFGVLMKFHSLCHHQAVLNQITEDALPGVLPDGYDFVQGIDLEVLSDSQALDALPDNAGVEFHYPLPGGTEFAVLFWNGTAWVEITQPMNAGNLASVLSTDAGGGLYKMSSSNGSSLNVLTTETTGTFVLVAK